MAKVDAVTPIPEQPGRSRLLLLLYAMKQHGGHFASHLADAWLHADSTHSRLLWDVFHELLEGYDRFVVQGGAERVVTHGTNTECPKVQAGEWPRCYGHHIAE